MKPKNSAGSWMMKTTSEYSETKKEYKGAIMDKKHELKIGMALHKIAMVVSEEDLKKIGGYLKEIEDAVLEDGKEKKDE